MIEEVVWEERLTKFLSDSYIGETDPYDDENLERVYDFFKNIFGVPKRIIYPCCHLDKTPVKSFPNSEVILLDNNEFAVNSLIRSGVKAIHGDVRDFRGKFDLVILLNPDIKSNEAIHLLERGGFVLTDNSEGNASRLLGNFRYRFLGTINQYTKPIDMHSVRDSRRLLRGKDRNLYSIFRKRF